MKRASAFLRAIAFLIDLLVLVLAAALLQSFSLLGYAVGAGGIHRGQPGLPLNLLYVFLGLFYFTYGTMNGAQTIGKKSLRLRVTRTEGEPVGLLRSLWRSCCYFLSAFPFFFGFLLAFLVKGRSLHDFLSGTIVTEEE